MKNRKDSATLIMKDFNTSHLVINKTSKQSGRKQKTWTTL